jgi:hypothetical protein
MFFVQASQFLCSASGRKLSTIVLYGLTEVKTYHRESLSWG